MFVEYTSVDSSTDREIPYLPQEKTHERLKFVKEIVWGSEKTKW